MTQNFDQFDTLLLQSGGGIQNKNQIHFHIGKVAPFGKVKRTEVPPMTLCWSATNRAM